jgi:hypothetical protein
MTSSWPAIVLPDVSTSVDERVCKLGTIRIDEELEKGGYFR